MARYSVSSTYRAFFAGSTRLLGDKELLGENGTACKTTRHAPYAIRRRRQEAICSYIGCMFSRQVGFKLLEPLQLAALVPDGDHELG
jgi:hypothetical protein